MFESVIILAIQLVVLGVVAWAAWYLTTSLPVPDPLGRVIRVIVMVVCIAVAVILLLKWAGISLGV